MYFCKIINPIIINHFHGKKANRIYTITPRRPAPVDIARNFPPSFLLVFLLQFAYILKAYEDIFYPLEF